jgi:hypothetical protein
VALGLKERYRRQPPYELHGSEGNRGGAEMERTAQGKHDASVGGGASETIQRERWPERIAQQMIEPIAVALVDVRGGLQRETFEEAPTSWDPFAWLNPGQRLLDRLGLHAPALRRQSRAQHFRFSGPVDSEDRGGTLVYLPTGRPVFCSVLRSTKPQKLLTQEGDFHETSLSLLGSLALGLRIPRIDAIR